MTLEKHTAWLIRSSYSLNANWDEGRITVLQIRKWKPRRLSNLSNITWLINGRAGLKLRPVSCQSLRMWPYIPRG